MLVGLAIGWLSGVVMTIGALAVLATIAEARYNKRYPD